MVRCWLVGLMVVDVVTCIFFLVFPAIAVFTFFMFSVRIEMNGVEWNDSLWIDSVHANKKCRTVDFIDFICFYLWAASAWFNMTISCSAPLLVIND